MNPTHSRRAFLAKSAAGFAALSAAPGSHAAETASSGAVASPRVKLGLSSYSYWHFRPPKVSIETVIEKASEFGVAGVDVLHRQMDIPEREPLTAEHRAHLRRLRRHAFLNGVSIICLSTHQSFMNSDAAEQTKNVEHTKKCIEIAAELGAASIRLNSGRWNTVDFDTLMANRGIEKPPPGRTEDEGFKWVIDGVQRCLAKAKECGVVLALENHWGLTNTPRGLLRILEALPSPWLGALMDTGNFLEEPYEKLQQIAAKTVFVQAKTYHGGGEWYTLELDYSRIAKILAKVNYRGFVSLEYEGKESADSAVPKSFEMLRKAFGA
jgi:L-ribulose-5-phosphate 3-epimerase